MLEANQQTCAVSEMGTAFTLFGQARVRRGIVLGVSPVTLRHLDESWKRESIFGLNTRLQNCIHLPTATLPEKYLFDAKITADFP